ncbi:phosphate acyltransferase PlsX [Paucilactobacillus hokkaidonensis JCM 18461]|uniref:Phosphate acyltransferase n=2 Tax=Paucilactobacillus hokkaidonensis TaxID=1193095 RepID=A0A0A1GYL1_9LACO|nr:phosphate acyltransferase PlsX [Paucilactobacillus hokkaidonensis]KRO09753.1 phosphate acyltransferase [Paucilactobacillus hokkaidonensis]BAP85581.1 phosphate acyltransferase PlsX [Paucilactobacillus hokkaidonensis JCM 18461]
MKIAVDAMGGDHAPQEIIIGVEQARDLYPDVEFYLYGMEDQIRPLVKNQDRLTIIPTTETIDMGEEPVRAIRRKKDSSIVRAANAVKAGEADAFFSAGNTGAVLAAGLFIVGRIKGIDRPGLTSVLPVADPKTDQQNFVYLDTGANAESKEKNLVQFAYLGKFYAQKVLKVAQPRVALLNNGTEEDKGDKLHKAVYQLLNDDPEIDFVGNVESSELLNGRADVVVTDGWGGNAALKATEGTAKTMLSLIKNGILNGGLRAKLGYLLMKPVFGQIGKIMGTSNYGGAVMLGLKAPVVKTHGSSKADAVKNTIGQIREMLSSKVIDETVIHFSAIDQAEDVDNSSKNS